MPVFDYIALDQKGKQRKGSLEATNAEKVTLTLKGEGVIPLSIKEQTILNKEISFNSKVKTKDLSLFCRQFRSLLVAGVPLINALGMLEEQVENKVLKSAIKGIYKSVEKGETIANGMKDQGKIFPSLLVNMVESGESSGSLDTALERMAEHFEKESKLRATVVKAMVYPICVLVAALGVVIFMMIKVVPQFVDMLSQVDADLPGITKAVVGVSNFFVHHWIGLLVVVIIVICAIIGYRSTESGKLFFAKLALRLPLFGNLVIKSSSSRLARLLGTLLTAGIPLIDAVEITARVMDNQVIRNVLLLAKEDVARGIPLSQSLEASGVFPSMVYQMLRIGEETGNMEEMLDKVADYYDEDVQNATEVMTTVLEPVIIIFLALLVGTIMLAILMPMMSLYSAIDQIAK